jgi:hypothetical protein
VAPKKVAFRDEELEVIMHMGSASQKSNYGEIWSIKSLGAKYFQWNFDKFGDSALGCRRGNGGPVAEGQPVEKEAWILQYM